MLESDLEYIVITGDLRSSKKIDKRSITQDNLKEAMKYLNTNFNEHIVSEFQIVGGDGFQGMISAFDIIMDIYFSLFRKIRHPFYLGVGQGSISTSLSEHIQEIDGKAFHFSKDALNTAKKKNRWIVLNSNLPNNDLTECVFNYIFDIMWSWTPRRSEIISFYRLHGENPQAIELAAHNFETGIRNIYKILEVGKYSLIKYGELVLEKEFKKNDPIPDQT
jgi:hypothetical protein